MPEATPQGPPSGAGPRRFGQGAVRPGGRGAAARRAGEDLEQLMSVAARPPRARARPQSITYSRKVFIPLTQLCRDRCHYCTFAKPPGAGCDGTVPTPGRGPRDRRGGPRARAARRRCSPSATGPRTATPAAREWLDERGYATTLDYLRAVAVRVLEETGLLPHLNPGVMSWEEIARLKPVAASMGLMLETLVGRLCGARRPALRLARTRSRRCGCARSRTPAGWRSRSPPASSSASARRARARRVAVRDPRAAPAVRARAGGHRPELPRQAGHRDARRGRAGG